MTIITKDRGSYIQKTEFTRERFTRYFYQIVEDTGRTHDATLLEGILNKTIDFIEGFEEVQANKLCEYILRYTNEAISTSNPDLKWVAASAIRRQLYKDVSKLRGFNYKKGYGNFHSLIIMGVESGLYDQTLINKYSQEEIEAIGAMIDPSLDKEFDYAGLDLLMDKYLIKNYDGAIVELPQERYAVVAMTLMQDEPKDKRMEYIGKAYKYVSNKLIGLATPTLMNTGKPQGSFSSCHVLTMDDDLVSIFDTNKDTARFSQAGAGIGIYMGFLRGRGSWIRGYKGRASGVTHPSRSLSVLSEYVNQLGSRPAGVALYLPVWHLDIFEFLELRLKTGTQEKRAHSIKTGICFPDEFWRRLEAKENWSIFDPYEFKKITGAEINNLYDKRLLREGEEPNMQDHAFTYMYRLAERDPRFQLRETVRAVDIYKGLFESRKTSGTPYIYNSDTVARLNPNGHAGFIYSSNLCTEIFQNQSPDKVVSEEIIKDGVDTYIKTMKKAGDMVTCNLSSLNHARVHTPEWEHLFEDVIAIQVRMLDNVISLDRAVVPQAIATNRKYRSIGLGGMGVVEHLTDNGFRWESKETTEEFGRIFKKTLKATIKASHELALEKGSYEVYEGSDWQNGAFFDKRGFYGDEWNEIREMASRGMRNAYIIAVAPTSGNAVLNDTTPSADPLFDVIYKEDKQGIELLRIPSNYNNKTKWYYKSGFEMDEMWAICHIAEAQKYVDQGISHNMHISADTKATEMLRLDLGAWRKGLKTVYYTYTSTMEKAKDCIMCEG